MTEVMGVINVTPDSFVAASRTPKTEDAVERALQMAADGATIIDVGGESTRPGAESISEDTEIMRVTPVIDLLSRQLPSSVRISIDTRNEVVARAAVAVGAHVINDMGATLGPVAADLGVGYIAGHMQGDPQTMQRVRTTTTSSPRCCMNSCRSPPRRSRRVRRRCGSTPASALARQPHTIWR